MHEVSQEYVVEHNYGETWKTCPDALVQITFYDANHCPGAAIITFEMPDGTVHVHTGDMRYHPKMQAYPVLNQGSINRKIDTVLLDTTYSDPKHDFQPQASAITEISSIVMERLGDSRRDNGDTLVLLSCYSIGKEKVLWESSIQTGQLVFVSERKMKMMEKKNKYTKG